MENMHVSFDESQISLDLLACCLQEPLRLTDNVDEAADRIVKLIVAIIGKNPEHAGWFYGCCRLSFGAVLIIESEECQTKVRANVGACLSGRAARGLTDMLRGEWYTPEAQAARDVLNFLYDRGIPGELLFGTEAIFLRQ